MTEPIIIPQTTKSDYELTISVDASKSWVRIEDSCEEIIITKKQLPKLIEAFQRLEKELENDLTS